MVDDPKAIAKFAAFVDWLRTNTAMGKLSEAELRAAFRDVAFKAGWHIDLTPPRTTNG